MTINQIHSCHLGPEISPEQVISEHYFMVLLKGSMKAYDGRKRYSMQSGDCFIARKNHLIRYTKFKEDDQFVKIIITLDEPFLKRFTERHSYPTGTSTYGDSFLFVNKNPFIKQYIQSLEPYYTSDSELDETFADIKREELLLILLRSQPELASIFFNFSSPHKIDLEEYMQQNFRFNVSLERFAFLTGRSVSSFKRDFKKTFGMPPGRWLLKKRLDEAYFQLSRQHQKPSTVYLEVGFEDLSHFSFLFKKTFGKTPSEVATSGA
ncbi:helix-turn-helix domain-containing protein [Spirosoma migulaei]